MNPIERAAADCAWARRPVAEKLVLFGGLLVAALVLPPWPTAAVVVGVVCGAVALARVRLRVFAAALAGPVVFVAIGVIPVALDVVGGLNGGAWFPASGVDRATRTAARAFAASSATIGLACTTTMASLLASARRAGLPPQLCQVVDMMYRLVGILIATARALHEAVALRLGLSSRRRAFGALGSLFASVFLHSMLRSRRMYEAMTLRAPAGATAMFARRTPVSAARMTAILGVLAVVILTGVAR